MVSFQEQLSSFSRKTINHKIFIFIVVKRELWSRYQHLCVNSLLYKRENNRPYSS